MLLLMGFLRRAVAKRVRLTWEARLRMLPMVASVMRISSISTCSLSISSKGGFLSAVPSAIFTIYLEYLVFCHPTHHSLSVFQTW